jgi:excisionase family DNA binding protein
LLEEPVQPEWVDYPTAERYSSLSHTTLWRYVNTGDIRAARVGRSVRIHLPSLKTFMEERIGAAADIQSDSATQLRLPGV